MGFARPFMTPLPLPPPLKLTTLKVLAHYQTVQVSPFKLAGTAMTQDFLTMIMGFFGAVLIGLFAKAAEAGVAGKLAFAFMCHNPNPTTGFDDY